MYAHPDWTPLPDFVRYGQVIRSAHQMLSGWEALGGPIDTTGEQVKSMVDTMLNVAWDPEIGGFHLAGSSLGPTYIEGTTIFVRDKCWWPQADGMKLLLAMARLHSADAPRYMAHLERLWTYIRTYVIDTRRGGWFPAGVDTNPKARKRPKATMWKDSSHETEALLDCLRLLDKL